MNALEERRPTTDLVEFYRAQLDDDAAWALACSARAGEIAAAYRADHRKVFSGGDVVAETRSANVAGHIARHDPARVLREVEAKREFLDFAVRTRDLAEQQPTEGQARDLRVKWAAYLTALKFDALRYADHPDYREEWKP